MASMVPTVELPPTMPFTLQVTAWLVVRITWAVNCCVLPRGRLRFRGNTVTNTPLGGALTVTAAEPDWVGSATLMALTVTLADEGTVVGAV